MDQGEHPLRRAATSNGHEQVAPLAGAATERPGGMLHADPARALVRVRGRRGDRRLVAGGARWFLEGALGFTSACASRLARALEPVVRRGARRYRPESTLNQLAGRRTLPSLDDPLTGFARRDQLHPCLGAMLASRDGDVVLGVIDLDRFKLVNLGVGHAAADAALVEVARRIRATAPPNAAMFRVGGDSFCVCWSPSEPSQDLISVGGRMLAALRVPIAVGSRFVQVRASIGMTAQEQRAIDADRLSLEAEMAMYTAKVAGGDRLEVLDKARRDRSLDRLALHAELPGAIEGDQLRVHFQPIMELASNRPAGVEALVRWQHPRRGLLGAGEFVPLAEEAGLVDALGACVLEEVCRVVPGRWVTPHGPLEICLNLSARQLGDPTYPELVRAAVAAVDLSPSSLCFEITETALVADPSQVHRTLDGLRQLGARVALDDFGTRYASLEYLRRFPVDVIKIDRSFIAGIAEQRHDRTIVAALIDLAHRLGLTVVAEGVEDDATRSLLARLGCDRAQGFLWSAPRAWPDLEDRLLAGADAPGGPPAEP